jgi:hypothetical protein
MELSGCVLKEISLPQELANPIVARSMAAHLVVRNQKDILEGTS